MWKYLIVLLLSQFSSPKLVQVVSFFRHGARYTINTLYDANDTTNIEGELTSVGMRQHQTFGQMLRS